MSLAHQPISTDSSKPSGSEITSYPRPSDADRAASARLYDELGRLAELMPDRYREVFCFRWGLPAGFPHLVNQTAIRFEIPKSTAELMLNRCLWNVARHAHQHELPALRDVLGPDPHGWAERAWVQAERRWGSQDCAFAETVMLLAAAGLDVPEAHRVARQHVVDIGLGRGNRWGRDLTDDERATAAGQAVDRILAHVVWPSDPMTFADLDAFVLQRPLPVWAPAKTGVFQSEKSGRLVQFDSDLELVILRQLDADPRVVSYQEQPVTIPYVIDGEPHQYTPDVLVRLDDGRAFIIEAKPREHLGNFTNWMKWASLARWCEQSGIGFWIGSPQRSIIEHRGVRPDPDARELVADEVQAGEMANGDYRALRQLVSNEQFGLIATAELLDWDVDAGRIGRAEGPDREEARQFWALIDQHLATHHQVSRASTLGEEANR